MNGMALCAGVGGLELGLGLAIGDYRCICYAEREAYGVAILAARIRDGLLDDAPIWDDIGTFDGCPWRGRVDIISAGFPCQPWSDAGQRRGVQDHRWIWPDIARIIREVEPRYVFLENVPGLLNGGGNPVFGSLADMGFDTEWGRFSAAGIGAPHLRQRIFILARRRESNEPGSHSNSNGSRQQEHKATEEDCSRVGNDERRDPGIICKIISNPGGSGQRTSESEISLGQQDTDRSCHGEGDGSDAYEVLAIRAGPIEGEISGEEPTHPNHFRRPWRTGGEEGWRSQLENRSWWEVEPPVGRVVDGAPDWVDRIRACGNGVVPAVAARAYIELRGRLDGRQ